jgi:hypothetical protein
MSDTEPSKRLTAKDLKAKFEAYQLGKSDSSKPTLYFIDIMWDYCSILGKVSKLDMER